MEKTDVVDPFVDEPAEEPAPSTGAGAFVLLDDDGRISALSEEAEQILGRGMRCLVGRRLGEAAGNGLAEFIAHELCNPLAAVVTLVELLELNHGDELDDEARRYLQQIIAGSDRIRESISDLTSLFGAPQTHQRVVVDAVDLVQQAIDRAAGPDHRHACRIEIGPMPPLRSDEGQLRLVLENLIRNAVKYRHPSRPLRIDIAACCDARGAVFSVTDNGIGVPVEDRARVFDLGYRVSRSQDVPGAGIGLALSRCIVERHGGRIWIDDVAAGTRVCLTVPTAPHRRRPAVV